MADKSRIPLSAGEALADVIVPMLAPFCEKIEVLGSIRRRVSEVGDVEIGILPLWKDEPSDDDLFGERTERVNLAHRKIRQLVEAGTFGLRKDKNGHTTCGEGSAFLTFKGFALDVFGARCPEAWGVTKIIRTGSGDFNKRLVRQRVEGGTILPIGMRFSEGRLLDRCVPVPTFEEIDVFSAIGLAYIEPEARL